MVGKRGRNRIEIDLAQLERLGMLQCTNEEIADFFGVHIDTIRDRIREDEAFSNALLKGKSAGKRSLRRIQWQKAQGGNVAMLIWLGKQWLKQTEKVNVSNLSDEQIIALLESTAASRSDEA